MQYLEAIEASQIVEEMVLKYHTDFADAKIKCVMRDKTLELGGRVIAARIMRASKILKYLTDFDYIVEFSQPIWDKLTKEQKHALADHELCHMELGYNQKTGEVIFDLKSHDIEEFLDILDRHGDYFKDRKRLDEIYKHSKGQWS